MTTRWIVALLSMTLIAAAQQAGPISSEREKDAALGAALAKEIRQHTEPFESPSVQKYVADLGGVLRAPLLGPSQPLTVDVVTDPMNGPTHEPVTLPGGYIFVAAALLIEARDEAEFAGVLAHAIAHVNLRRPRVNTGRIPLVYMGGWDDLGMAPTAFLTGQRDLELEADRNGERLVDAAHYDPKAFLRYIARVQPATSNRSGLNRAARLENLEQTVEAFPTSEYRAPGASFLRIPAEVGGLMGPGTDKQKPDQSRTPPMLQRADENL